MSLLAVVMSLTGTPFFATAIMVAALAVLVPLLVWHRVKGSALVRGAVRLLMVVTAQASAVLVVFVAVNDANGLYDTWGDLLGTDSHVVAAPDLGADGTGGHGVAGRPRVRQSFTAADEPDLGAGVRVTQLTGRVSGAEGEVYVWAAAAVRRPRPSATRTSPWPNCCPAIRARPGTGSPTWTPRASSHR